MGRALTCLQNAIVATAWRHEEADIDHSNMVQKVKSNYIYLLGGLKQLYKNKQYSKGVSAVKCIRDQTISAVKQLYSR